MITAENVRTGKRLAEKVEKAQSLKARCVGLLGRKDLASGEALWLSPCAQVHTFFMAFPIDVLFLDREGKAVRLCENMVPWRVSPWVWKAAGCLEMKAGSLAGQVAPGDIVKFIDHD